MNTLSPQPTSEIPAPSAAQVAAVAPRPLRLPKVAVVALRPLRPRPAGGSSATEASHTMPSRPPLSAFRFSVFPLFSFSAFQHFSSRLSAFRFAPFPISRLTSPLSLPLLLALLLAVFTAHAATIAVTNVTIANVTPGGFSVVSQGSSAVAIEVFANAAGTSNLVTELGFESYPVDTGHSGLVTPYERRISQNGIRSATRGLGISHLRVSNCRPATAYYFRLIVPTGGTNLVVYPTAGLATVTTPAANTFVVSSAQAVIDVPGVNNDGYIVLLGHTNSPYALAGIVGDGAGTNQVVFNVNDLFALGGGNFNASGAHDFTATLLGANGSKVGQTFSITLNSSFAIAQAQFTSFGIEFAALGLVESIVRAGQGGSIPLSYNSSVSVSNLTVQIQFPTNRLAGFSLSNAAPAVNTATMTALTSNSSLLTISARPGQSFQGQLALGSLVFTAVSNQPSAFVTLHMVQPAFAKADGVQLGNVVLQDARVIIIGEEPLLEAGTVGGVRHLTMYGKPWASYALQYSTNLAQPNWTLFTRIPMTNQWVKFENLDNSGNRFYRAYQFLADPPIVEAQRGTNGTRRLLAFGTPGTSYTVESAPGLSAPVTWTPVLNYTLTNSFRHLDNLNTNQAQVFYRLRKQ